MHHNFLRRPSYVIFAVGLALAATGTAQNTVPTGAARSRARSIEIWSAFRFATHGLAALPSAGPAKGLGLLPHRRYSISLEFSFNTVRYRRSSSIATRLRC